MVDKVQAEYKSFLSLNGDELVISSSRVRWSGDRTEHPGTWLVVSASSNGREIYQEQREITKEFRKYAELKHSQIVQRVRKCGSLEEVSSTIEGIF